MLRTRLIAPVLALVLSMGALLAACTPPVDWSPAVRGWIGAHVDDLVDQWGPPDSAHTFRDGRRVLVYAASQVREHSTLIEEPLYPGSIATVPRWVVTGTAIVECRAEFRADRRGIIVDAFYHGAGEACRKLFRRVMPPR
jgi:hypothetical protein